MKKLAVFVLGGAIGAACASSPAVAKKAKAVAQTVAVFLMPARETQISPELASRAHALAVEAKALGDDCAPTQLAETCFRAQAASVRCIWEGEASKAPKGATFLGTREVKK